jgi:hypothetical protein
MTVDEKGKLVRLFMQVCSILLLALTISIFSANFAICMLKSCSVLHTGEQCCSWGYNWCEKVMYQYMAQLVLCLISGKKVKTPCIILVLVINCSMKNPLKSTGARHAFACTITPGTTKCGCVDTQKL